MAQILHFAYEGGTLCYSDRRARGGQGNNWLWLTIWFKVERAFSFIFFFAIIWNKPKAFYFLFFCRRVQKGQRMLETLNASLSDSWPIGFRTDINCLFREMGSSVSPTAGFFFFFSFFFPPLLFLYVSILCKWCFYRQVTSAEAGN